MLLARMIAMIIQYETDSNQSKNSETISEDEKLIIERKKQLGPFFQFTNEYERIDQSKKIFINEKN